MAISDDIRYAARRLRSRPLFVLVAVVTLGLSIGFNAVIFSLLDSFLLRPLPIADPGRVFTLDCGKISSYSTVSFPDYIDIRDRNQVFSQTAVSRTMLASLTLRRHSSLTWGYLVSGIISNSCWARSSTAARIAPPISRRLCC